MDTIFSVRITQSLSNNLYMECDFMETSVVHSLLLCPIPIRCDFQFLHWLEIFEWKLYNTFVSICKRKIVIVIWTICIYRNNITIKDEISNLLI